MAINLAINLPELLPNFLSPRHPRALEHHGKNYGRSQERCGHNRGYFYRKGRGWYANDNGRMTSWRDPSGQVLKDPKTPDKIVREAHARWHYGADNLGVAELYRRAYDRIRELKEADYQASKADGEQAA